MSKAADPVAEMTAEQLLRTCMEFAVRLAITRHNIELEPDTADEEEVALDAAGACFGEETCAGEPIPEVAELLRRLGASGMQGPRCPNPNCGSDKLWIFWHENRIGCDSCRSSYYCLHMADFVQFFPAGASGVEKINE